MRKIPIDDRTRAAIGLREQPVRSWVNAALPDWTWRDWIFAGGILVAVFAVGFIAGTCMDLMKRFDRGYMRGLSEHGDKVYSDNVSEAVAGALKRAGQPK